MRLSRRLETRLLQQFVRDVKSHKSLLACEHVALRCFDLFCAVSIRRFAVLQICSCRKVKESRNAELREISHGW